MPVKAPLPPWNEHLFWSGILEDHAVFVIDHLSAGNPLGGSRRAVPSGLRSAALPAAGVGSDACRQRRTNACMLETLNP